MPCVLFEDEHLLVVNKPAGLNTHSPSPYAGEGIYEWLRNREVRWRSLAIIHRLDKQTSGVIVFARSPAANKALGEQFETRLVRKTYLMMTDRNVRIPAKVKSTIKKAGDRFVDYPWRPGADAAETEFEAVPVEEARKLVPAGLLGTGVRLVRAKPLTGRTHQIRLHAASGGFPVLGDTLYGGSTASRVCLHAWRIAFCHPVTKAELTFTAEWKEGEVSHFLRAAVIDPEETDSFRTIHGAADGVPNVFVDKLGDYLLIQSPAEQQEADLRQLGERLAGKYRCKGVYHKTLTKHTRGKGAEASPRFLTGSTAPERFYIRENGLAFEMSFREGYSVGLFLDQRENRRKLATGYVGGSFPALSNARGPSELLNAFAYTCGFSVAAARGGAGSTSLDLSKKYLEWGQRNFEANKLPLAAHDFIFGDVFDWMKRLSRKGRSFDVIILDPPTFSQSRQHGVFKAEKDYGKLVTAALALLKAEGVLLASSNAAGWKPEDFVETLHNAAQRSGYDVNAFQYAPQPPDFPVSREEPAYLKTAWLHLVRSSIPRKG